MKDPSRKEQDQEMHRLRLALQQSNQEWQHTFNAVSDWVSIIDSDFTITQTNKAVEKMLGIPPESIIGRRCYEVIYGSDGPGKECPVSIMFNTRTRSQTEIKFKKTGCWALVSADPIFSQTGEVIGAVHVARDISRRKAAEESLHENEERLAFTAKAGDLGLWDWHADIRWLFTDTQFLSVTGLSREDARSLNLDDWLGKVHPKDRERSRITLCAYLDGKTECPEIVLRFWNIEKLKWVWLYASGRVIGRKAPSRMVGIIQDITHRKEQEEEREDLIGKLSKALSEVKTLSGLLPICSQCKMIRDDQGYWNQIEGYIQRHSNAAFSHGICPDCAKRLYPGYDIYEP